MYTFTYRRSKRANIRTGSIEATDLAGATHIAQAWVAKWYPNGVLVSVELAS